MKEDLLKWVNDQAQLDVTSKFILYRLAQFADADCCAWAKIQTLVAATNTSDRTVQGRLGMMIRAGLLRDSGRKHNVPKSRREVPIYILAPEIDGLGLEAAQAMPTPAESAGVSKADPRRIGARPPQLSAPVYELNGTEGVEEDKSSPTPGVRACEPRGGEGDIREGGFERVLTAWSRAIPDGVSRPADAAAWSAAGSLIDEVDLVRAALGYLDKSPAVKRGRGLSLARWLDEQRWEAWLGAAETPAVLAAPVWPGPAEVRTAFASEPQLGDGWVISFLDRSGWSEADRKILARTGVAADRITHDGRRVLAEFKISVGRA